MHMCMFDSYTIVRQIVRGVMVVVTHHCNSIAIHCGR